MYTFSAFRRILVHGIGLTYMKIYPLFYQTWYFVYIMQFVTK